MTQYYNKPSFLKRMGRLAKQERQERERKEKEKQQPVKEEVEKHGVMAFGRMNPPTAGHEQVVNKVHEVAKEHKAEHNVILSHSQDAKKNPLPVDKKVQHAKHAFPGTNVSGASKEKPTILHHAADMHKAGVKHLHVVAGSDRKEAMHELLHKYNGQKAAHGHYNFKSITVHSSGDRDPDSEGTSGVSGTKMREHAASGNQKEFHKNLPSKMKPEHKDALYHDLRSHMNIKEETIEQQADRIKQLKGFKDQVKKLGLDKKEVEALQDVNEVLDTKASAGDWIHDFVHSTNPKFNNKSKEKRIKMALAAYYAKKRNEEVVQEGAYEKSEENKRSADAAKKQGDMFAHHLHMADHHDNLAQWHGEKGRHGEADRHAQKSEEHHEKAMSLKEAATTGNPGNGYHGQHSTEHNTDDAYAKIHAHVKSLTDSDDKTVKHYLDSAHGRHLVGHEHDHDHIKKDFKKFKKYYRPEMHEEIQIDELKNTTLQSYKDKAKKSADELAAKGEYKKSNDRMMGHMKASGKQIEKTSANITRALRGEPVKEGTIQPSGDDKIYTATSAPTASTAKDDSAMVKKVKGFKFFRGVNEPNTQMAVKENAPVAPVPDKKYIKGTPEWKAHKEAQKPRTGHPTNVKEEAEELDEKSQQARRNKTYKNLMAASKGAKVNRELGMTPADTGHKNNQQMNKAIGRAVYRGEVHEGTGKPVDVEKVNAAGDKPHEEKWEPAKKTKLKKEETMKTYKEFLQSLDEKLIGGQKKLDKNHNGKIDGQDFAILRGQKKTNEELESIEEIKMADLPSRKIQGKSYGADYEDPEGKFETKDDMKKADKKTAGRKSGSVGVYKPRKTMSKLKSAGATYK